MNDRHVCDKIFGTANTVPFTFILLLIFWMACADEGNILFNEALNLFEKEDYRGAITKWELLIENYENHRQVESALLHIGQAYANLKNFKKARESYETVLKEFPNGRLKNKTQFHIKELLIDETDMLFDEKQYEQAFQKFQKLATGEELQGYPDLQFRATYKAAQSSEKLGNYDDALAYFNDVIELHTRGPFPREQVADSLLMIGRLNYKVKGDYERSLSAFQDLLEKIPESKLVGGAAVGIVLSLSKLDRHDDLQNRVKKMSEKFSTVEWVKILKSYADGLKQLSYADLNIPAWEKDKTRKQARLAFEKVLKSNLLEDDKFHALNLETDVRSHIAESYLDEGKDYYDRKNFESAQSTIKILLSEFPQSNPALMGEARLLLAHSYRLEGEYNQAYREFDKLTSLEFGSSPELQEEAMYYAADCLREFGMTIDNKSDVLNEALARYTEFLLRFPHSELVSNAYHERGIIFAVHTKEYELARSNYNRALESTDNLNRKAKIQFDIGNSYYDQEYFEKALAAYNLLLQEYEESGYSLRARMFIAHIHRRAKEWNGAIKAYETIFANHRNVEFGINVRVKDGTPIFVNFIAFSYYEVGEAYFKRNEFERAFTSFARIATKPKDGAKDFRTDSIAPYAMHYAMRALIELSEGGEFGTEAKSALHGISGTSPEQPIPSEISEVLARFATKYISDLRERNSDLKDDNAKLENIILSARTQLRFADIQRQKLKRYDSAATAYEKIGKAYPPTPDPRLDLIKLQAKYYEGLCYEELSRPKDAMIAYRETVTLFITTFQSLIDYQHIDAPGINKKILDYCVKTALDYAEKACEKLKGVEYGRKACAKVKASRRKLKDQTRELDSSNTSSTRHAPQKSHVIGQLSAEKIAKIASQSTVLLRLENEKGGGFNGSGFFVGAGLIATNYHVIRGKVRGTATLVGSKKPAFAIIGYTAIDADRDLAILKVRAFDVEPLFFANSDEVHRGESVYVVGNPLGLVNVVSDGKISSIQWVESISKLGSGKRTLVGSSSSDNTSDKLFMMTAPISPGNSGGPVLNNRGEVIGIAVSQLNHLDPNQLINRAQNLNFAIPVSYLQTLLNRAGYPEALNNLEIIN